MSVGETEQRASSVRPLLEGDMVNNRRVRGFAWRAPAPGRRSNHQDDRLLLDGDEQLTSPPDRLVPQSSDSAVTAGVIPPADLSPDWVQDAGAVDPAIAPRVDALLDLPEAAWRPVVRPLFAAVHATGHRAWLAGGAVRDVILGAPVHTVNDLDLSGTVPTGRFADIAYQALRAAGMSECAISVCPSDLVCSVARPGARKTMIEYRGLSRGGFPYPAVGSRLAEDARHRDYSFNALLYDVLDHRIVDPSEYGLRDLLGKKRRFKPLNPSRVPYLVAEMLVRAMKFYLRWEGQVDFDLEPLREWAEALPATLWDGLTDHNWHSLRRTQRDIPASLDRQRQFAAKLPQQGQNLIAALIGSA